MHKRIRLTGRKQLSPAYFDLNLTVLPGRKVITFSPLENVLKGLASNARITLRLVENKFVEYVDLGTVDSPIKISEVKNQFFQHQAVKLEFLLLVNRIMEFCWLVRILGHWSLILQKEIKIKKVF